MRIGTHARENDMFPLYKSSHLYFTLEIFYNYIFYNIILKKLNK